jgi:hypothetical protein
VSCDARGPTTEEALLCFAGTRRLWRSKTPVCSESSMHMRGALDYAAVKPSCSPHQGPKAGPLGLLRTHQVLW